MRYRKLHDWIIPPRQAIALQRDLQKQIRIEPLKQPVRYVAGADISYNRFSTTAYAGFVVIDINTFEIVATSSAVEEMMFPYIPGLLSFREAPPLLAAWEKLEFKPDVVMFDGQGIAHPRRLGIASHLGLFLEIPTIGCGKTKLYGNYTDLAVTAPSVAPLVTMSGEEIGAAVRTKKNTNPVFVSPGHRIDLRGSIETVLACVSKYRIPEPTRQAHLFVNEQRRTALLAA
jgi:deoxyribonuclease V